MTNKSAAKTICYVVCYKDPNYIRTLTLTSALQKIDGIKLVIVKNKNRGVLRYVEVPVKLLWTRFRRRPDTFIVGFRGHEIFWLLYPSMVGRPIIFDEFINLHDWLISEHKKVKLGSAAAKFIDAYMRWVHNRSWLILEDTKAHAQLSESIYGTPADKFKVIPVGADEVIFHHVNSQDPGKAFEIFFFGNMLPLHGLDVILDAIKKLSDEGKLDGMHFTLAGGRGSPMMLKKISDFIILNKLSNFVTHLEWIPYQQLPEYITKANLCLGGPFGNTPQAQRVITGKTFQFLAMAKPTAIGRNEASKEFVDRKNSLVIEQGSPKALAKALEWAKQHPKQVEKIGQEGKKLYDSRFSIRKISEILNSTIYG